MTALDERRTEVSPPTVQDFCSDTLVHGFGDLWNPPGLTNFLGCAQVDADSQSPPSERPGASQSERMHDGKSVGKTGFKAHSKAG